MGKIIGSITGANAAQKAANEAAAKSEAAGKQAAWAQAFRPIGFTNTFGSSQFQTEIDPQTGLPRVTSAGYTMSPEIQALQQGLFGLTPGALSQVQEAQGMLPGITAGAQQLYGLGSQFLPSGTTPSLTGSEQQLQNYLQQLGTGLVGAGTGVPSDVQAYQQQLQNLAGQITPTSYDTGAAAQRYYEQQQGLLEPTRQQEEQRLAASAFGRGRAGLNISGQGQPELYALAKAREQQNAAIAANAQDVARQQLQQDISLGTGLGAQAVQAGQQGQLFNLGLTQQGLGMLGQGTGLDEAARQRLMQEATFGQGLMAGGLGLQGAGYGLQTQALGPLQSYLSQVAGIEELGQMPYQQSLQLAQLQSGLGGAAGATQAQAISSAGQQRAQAAQQAAATNTAFLQAAIGAAAGGFGGGFGGAAAGGGFGGLGGLGNLEWQYASNPFKTASGPFNLAGSFEV